MASLANPVYDDGKTTPNRDHNQEREPELCVIPGKQQQQQQNWNTIAPSTAQFRAEKPTTSLLFVHHCVAAASPIDLIAAASSPKVDQFYNSSYLSRRAVLGDDFPGIDHSHGGRQSHEHTLTENDVKVLELYKAFELPSIPIRQALSEIFYEKCWTWMPVVDDGMASGDTSLREISLLVLQAVLLAATSTKPECDMTLPAHPQYRRIKAIIDTGAERNPLNLLVALCLMQFYAPAAPNDISTDHPRFWGSYALGLAQQMGLNIKSTKRSSQEGLRRRVWWTLYARDSIMSSAHGRPRIVNPADCSIEPPSIYDFPDPSDIRAQIFVSYVSITGIMCDLCQLLTRQNDPPSVEKNEVGLRLLDWVRSLPPALLLVQPTGIPRPYSFDLAQLHVHLLTTIIILYRPQSIFCVQSASSPAIVASNLSFRIFEAMELRGHTCSLSSGFAWHLLVTAIPQLSCLGIPSLREECKSNLDTLEGCFRTLASTRPSAANNLRNIQEIRGALESKEPLPKARLSANASVDVFSFCPLDLFGPYGVDVPTNYDRITAALECSVDRTLRAAQNIENVHHGNENMPQMFYAQTQSSTTTRNNIGDQPMLEGTPDFEFLGSNFPEDGWMRNWVNELHLFCE
ncbi:uncharacterized protein Z519_04348 [Cladophialophora bantiana CBS 173.52]|uniref:Xylanolytic transcriptional activator regulatory domain-containing protein n=1 Tax=Cladophialophora bantiana (strain ATCC 10958 / CBS 173.52 / CDC B-1940 / NIH 8579) TaxID=1442370 RepID=A0A0D2G6Y0_CLAB1|nr:uncharacterized protein Z519_04348 [Cladophialophora bantiana CBS 173.52]KIW94372.1 hypothetical protein Z519_04348 [Cladophialophora bantiana CBS 173.52]